MLFDDNYCIWCDKQFEEKEEYDKHYLKCANENHIKPYEEEAWEIIYNPNRY